MLMLEGRDGHGRKGYAMYGVVIAHKEGAAIERIATAYGTADTMAGAQVLADRWTRRHGHRPLDCDRNGFYAYADRLTRPAIRVRTNRR
jgi:hypothetical protein